MTRNTTQTQLDGNRTANANVKHPYEQEQSEETEIEVLKTEERRQAETLASRSEPLAGNLQEDDTEIEVL